MRFNTNNKGFTLIETVVALVIAGIILSVIYYGFSLSIRITKSGNNVLFATNVSKKVFNDFLLRKNTLALEDGYEEDGEIDSIKYKIEVKNCEFNINNSFTMTITKYYKILIKIFFDRKEYDFEYFFEK